MNEGVCEGGPLRGTVLVSRFPSGILLVDKPAGVCWIYEWQPDRGVFVVRDEQPAPVHTDGPVNRYRAAAEGTYDVVAAPWVVSPNDGQEAADGNAGQ
ncbi:hypothetical protein AB0J14_04765 [Micromonospora arborensis]|uniref:hypothetical protein n=1 Tax=Micromonospora arborensis TaxID=2116518 RepID=UPI00340CC39F